ncbi:hypothetical protein GCM10022225_52100 [Plantactinospora mayteni]|uniref:Uncharacterized protein n=1 Tax=Plantactinospora mayteni TaxID=566021 RepID=A0ABQ4EYY6_9ACTN|nr:hypothetical protein [Plantactinospora mayteni]GIG99873.1 hypothetical protein Pma05_64460 [Plantactinospora mayteni]
MRARLKNTAIRGLVATVVATGVAVPAAPRSARAVDPGTIIQVAQFAYAAYSLYNDSKSGGLTLDQAVTLMISEVRRSEQAIKNHMDALTVAEVRGCTEHAMLEFVESQDFSLSLKQRFAQDATACVTAINVRYDVVGQNFNFGAMRDLGVLLTTLGPVALAARAQARLQTAQLEEYLIAAFTKMQATFQVGCDGYFDRFYLPIPNEEEVWQVYPELFIPGHFQCTEHGGGPMASRHEYALWRWGAFAGYPDPANPGRMLSYYPHYQALRDELAQRSLSGILAAALAELRS